MILPIRSSIVPVQSGIVPVRSGTLPGILGTILDRTGTIPDHTGTILDHYWHYSGPLLAVFRTVTNFIKKYNQYLEPLKVRRTAKSDIRHKQPRIFCNYSLILLANMKNVERTRLPVSWRLLLLHRPLQTKKTIQWVRRKMNNYPSFEKLRYQILRIKNRKFSYCESAPQASFHQWWNRSLSSLIWSFGGS